MLLQYYIILRKRSRPWNNLIDVCPSVDILVSFLIEKKQLYVLPNQIYAHLHPVHESVYTQFTPTFAPPLAACMYVDAAAEWNFLWVLHTRRIQMPGEASRRLPADGATTVLNDVIRRPDFRMESCPIGGYISPPSTGPAENIRIIFLGFFVSAS